MERAVPGAGDTPTRMVYENRAQRPSQVTVFRGHLDSPSPSRQLSGITQIYILNIPNDCAVPEKAQSMLRILFLKIQGPVFYIPERLSSNKLPLKGARYMKGSPLPWV